MFKFIYNTARIHEHGLYTTVIIILIIIQHRRHTYRRGLTVRLITFKMNDFYVDKIVTQRYGNLSKKKTKQFIMVEPDKINPNTTKIMTKSKML